MRYYMGIDPGASGAVAVLFEGVNQPETFDFSKDLSQVAAAIRSALGFNILDEDKMVAYVERVHSMPKQGVASSFSFGASFGAICGILAFAKVPYELVTPSKWKKDMGLSSDKAEALAMARRLFPAASLERKKDIGRAEALLIAEWGRRQGR